MFRIGEFSRIAQVSGRLLRYYDEIGLLSPEFTDLQTGYRYYSAYQLPTLNRILVLKELGLSLDQIRRLLKEPTSTEELRGMLALRKAQIEQTLSGEMTRLHIVEARLQQIETHGQIQEPDVIIKTVPAQHFLSVRDTFAGVDSIRQLVQKMSRVVPSVISPGLLNSIAIVIHSTLFDPDAIDADVGYLLTAKAPKFISLSEEYTLMPSELPPIQTTATLVHVGRIHETHRTYGLLGTWLEQNQWQISGTWREVIMQLPVVPEGDAVIELQIPVLKPNSHTAASIALDFDVT
jgi:DNA-binding transcriptional MerR regulator